MSATVSVPFVVSEVERILSGEGVDTGADYLSPGTATSAKAPRKLRPCSRLSNSP